MNFRVAALCLAIVLFMPAFAAAESAPSGAQDWPGPGLLLAGANRDAQITMCQTQHMNCNQRCNKRYEKGSTELRDCRDNCNTQLTTCFNIANTIPN